MSRRASKTRKARVVNPALLRAWPLRSPDSDSDKDDRGTVLVAGGSAQVPGSLILSGVAALRAGAGKLQLAAPKSIALSVGVSVLEARVFPLSETSEGSLGKGAGKELSDLADSVNAVLIGPGMVDDKLAGRFAKQFLRRRPDCAVVIDAACIGGLSASKRLGNPTVLTPHSGEMAALFGVSKETVEGAPAEFAVEAAAALDAVMVMKGATTFIATPDELFSYSAGDVGLATSGSGDVLSGIITGLLGRGIAPDQAAVWGVAAHGAAGNALAKKVGGIGFLARELLDEIPRAILRGVLR
jgi:ADP-dependent NAD(P)H-hydrate dehydratase